MGSQRKTAIPDYTDFFQNDFRKFSTPTHFGIGFGCQNRPENFGAKMDYPRRVHYISQFLETKKFFSKSHKEVNKMGRYVTRSLDRESYEKLVKVIRCGYEHDGVKHRPNYQIATILVLEANLGCRIGDIIALTTDSIVNDGGIWKLNITEEKTGKKRYFIVPKPIKAYIDDYCRCSGIKEGRLLQLSVQCFPAVWCPLSLSFRAMIMQRKSGRFSPLR